MIHLPYLPVKKINLNEEFEILNLELFPKVIQDNWMYLQYTKQILLSVKDGKLLEIKSEYENGKILLSDYSEAINEWIVSPDGTGLDGSQILYPFFINLNINRIPKVKESSELDYQKLVFDLMILTIDILKEYNRFDEINIKELLIMKKKIEEIISEFNIKDILE